MHKHTMNSLASAAQALGMRKRGEICVVADETAGVFAENDGEGVFVVVVLGA